MAQDTFVQLWNRVLLFAPDLPPYIAQEFIKEAHKKIVGEHYWSELKADAEIHVPAWYKTGTVAWTLGSPNIVGTGTLWDTGTNVAQFSQIQLGNEGAYYTIITITDDTNIVLDRNVAYATSSGEDYHIGQLYLEFPTDLKALDIVRDKDNAWKVMTNYYTKDWLDRIDPNRSSSGTPTVLVSVPPRTDSSGNIIPRYELWPPPSTAKDYVYRYRKNATTFASSTDRGLEAVDSEAYLFYALALAAMWPGTKDKPNPFFSPDVHRQYMKQYEDVINGAVVEDHDRDQQQVIYDWMWDDQLAPIDAKYFQNHGFL